MTAPAAGSSDSTKDRPRPSSQQHWLVMNANREIVGCHCGFSANTEDGGYGDSVVDHLIDAEWDRCKAVYEARVVAAEAQLAELHSLAGLLPTWDDQQTELRQLRVTLGEIREWRQGVIDHCSAERIDPPAWCASLAALLGERQPPNDRVGYSLWLDREQWGHVIDALIASREAAVARKAANSESTSDLRAAAIGELIVKIGDAAVVGEQQ